MLGRALVTSLLGLGLMVSCTDEATTPIDLNATTTTATSLGDGRETTSPDANADERQRVEEFAKEECRKDPSREFGVVVFADPETGDELSRYEFPCSRLDE